MSAELQVLTEILEWLKMVFGVLSWTGAMLLYMLIKKR